MMTGQKVRAVISETTLKRKAKYVAENINGHALARWTTLPETETDPPCYVAHCLCCDRSMYVQWSMFMSAEPYAELYGPAHNEACDDRGRFE